MRVVWGAVLAWGLSLASATAEPVSVSFSLPSEFADRPVTWSATPTDLAADADMLEAMVVEAEAFAGPWNITLEPGAYLVSAFSEVEVFETEVTIVSGTAQAYEVPLLSLEASIPFRCPDAPVCSFKDDATGLLFDLPKGWAAEKPYYFDFGDGTLASELSAVFFEDIEGDGADVWFLNPPEWVVEENGPCQEVKLGPLCTFDLSSDAAAAIAVIAPSLRVSETSASTGNN